MKVKTLVTACAVLAILAGMTATNKSHGKQNQGTPSRSKQAALELTEVEELNILHMREEEKLARDVYLVMYELWGAEIFANISDSEQQHMDAIENLITRYGLTDPIVDDAVGQFSNPDFKELYDKLIEAGSVSLEEALKIGVQIEELDIADLELALQETTQRNIQRVFENLLDASNSHLEAFNACLDGDCICSPDA